VVKVSLGEFIEVSSDQGTMSLISGLFSIAAICLYALIQSDAENDDDDSNSGGDGGLMQPVV
jgi:hypothetical protein